MKKKPRNSMYTINKLLNYFKIFELILLSIT